MFSFYTVCLLTSHNLHITRNRTEHSVTQTVPNTFFCVNMLIIRHKLSVLMFHRIVCVILKWNSLIRKHVAWRWCDCFETLWVPVAQHGLILENERVLPALYLSPLLHKATVKCRSQCAKTKCQHNMPIWITTFITLSKVNTDSLSSVSAYEHLIHNVVSSKS